MRASRCGLCSSSVLHLHRRRENGDSPRRFHPALRPTREGELFFHTLLFSCLLLKIILMLKRHGGGSALLPFSKTENSLKATIRHLANHLVRTLKLKPGKTPGLGWGQTYYTTQVSSKLCELEEGDAPRQKDLSFNCPGSYHVPGPAEVNRACVLRGGGGVGWRRLAQCLGLGLRDH